GGSGSDTKPSARRCCSVSGRGARNLRSGLRLPPPKNPPGGGTVRASRAGSYASRRNAAGMCTRVRHSGHVVFPERDCRTEEPSLRWAIGSLRHSRSYALFERAFIGALSNGCHVPSAAIGLRGPTYPDEPSAMGKVVNHSGVGTPNRRSKLASTVPKLVSALSRTDSRNGPRDSSINLP